MITVSEVQRFQPQQLSTTTLYIKLYIFLYIFIYFYRSKYAAHFPRQKCAVYCMHLGLAFLCYQTYAADLWNIFMKDF